MNRTIWGYDFEVFSKINWWCCTFIEKENRDKPLTFINDIKRLISFYNENKDSIFVGYNSRQYDQFVFKGILSGIDPMWVNEQLIMYNKKGYDVVPNANTIHLNNYDCIIKDKSLKQLEAFMGDVIKESSVSFDTDIPLTAEQEKEIVTYNIHDVCETLKVLDYTIDDFNAQLELISMFNLDAEKFNKTKSQLVAHVLGAVKQRSLDDEFEIQVPANLKMPTQYQHVIDWYHKSENKSYKLPLKTNVISNSVRQFTTNIVDVPCVFGYGGLHGSKDNEVFEGIIITVDVASLYPSLMINENYLSRKLKKPRLFKEIRDKRLELKKIGDPRQKPLKIVINSSYGILKDIHSACYDPVQSNNVCLAGQWYLTELAIRLGNVSEILQINTDGIYMRVNTLSDVENVKNIAKEWEDRTGLQLEFDIYKHGKLIQKDVNNYLLIDMDTKKYKAKGAYVKKLTAIDYDLPIINKALVNYFVNDIPVETTIKNEDNLIEFQKVIKLSSLYKDVVYGTGNKAKVGNKERVVVTDGKKLNEKVHRVFASTRDSDKGIYKIKTSNGEICYEKVPYTPDKCFIYNDDIHGVKVPEYLDKQYYIDMAKDRISQFLEKKQTVVDTTSNVLYKILCNSVTFYDFLVACNGKITDSVLISYIKANCCFVYGKTFKLLQFKKYFKLLYEKNKMTTATLNKKFTDEFIKNSIQKHSQMSKSGKSLTDIDFKVILEEIFEYLPNEDIDIYEILKVQIELFGEPRYKDENYPSNRWFVLNVRNVIAPNINIYNIKTGEFKYIKVNKSTFAILPLQDGDIIDVIKTNTVYGEKIVGKDEKGINIIDVDTTKTYDVITKYNLIQRDYSKGKSLITAYEEIV